MLNTCVYNVFTDAVGAVIGRMGQSEVPPFGVVRSGSKRETEEGGAEGGRERLERVDEMARGEENESVCAREIGV